jgi:hypothetical protein
MADWSAIPDAIVLPYQGVILRLHGLNEPVRRAPGDAQTGGYPVQTLMVMAVDPDLV